MKAGTRQPRKQIVMKGKDRLTVAETEWLLELVTSGPPGTHGTSVAEKLARVLAAAQQASEKAYLIRNTENRRPKPWKPTLAG